MVSEDKKVVPEPRFRWQRLLPIGMSLILCLVLSQSNDLQHHYKSLSSPLHAQPEFHHMDFSALDELMREGPTWTPDKDELVIASNGAVASDVEMCSEMGVEILKRGGFAADAAVTVGLCIGVINSFSSGIGGGGFVTTKRFDEEDAITIDAREMAPALAFKDMYKGNPNASQHDGLAVAIPGELKGLYTLYSMHGSGKLSWEELVMPVANLATNGWTVNQLLERALQFASPYIYTHKEDWAFALNEDGFLKKQGDHIKRSGLGETLRQIALNGSDAIFYDPESYLVKSMVDITQKRGGILQASDFAQYKVVVEPALKVENFTHKNLTVYTSSGASSGLALKAGLSILNRFPDVNDINSAVQDFSPLASHRIIEVMKWMASVRSNLGDPYVHCDESDEHCLRRKAVLQKTHDERYSQFSEDSWINQTYNAINDSATLPSWKDYHPAYQDNDSHGTAHFSVLDSHGNAVSFTTTVNLLFGSLVHDPVTGVMMNDEMDDFSIPDVPNAFGLHPSIYNFIEPFKRPLSSTAPTIVMDPETNLPQLVIGCAGGSRITTAILEAIIRVYHYELSLLETIAYPRLHHQLLPNVVSVESPGSKKLEHSLMEKGHVIEMIDPMTAMCGIQRVGDEIHAQSDFWRKIGRAAGY